MTRKTGQTLYFLCLIFKRLWFGVQNNLACFEVALVLPNCCPRTSLGQQMARTCWF